MDKPNPDVPNMDKPSLDKAGMDKLTRAKLNMDRLIAEKQEFGEDNLKIDKAVYFLGQDIRKVPCFRNSIIFGICSGVVGGLGTFLFTSKILFSTNMSLGTFWLACFCYWLPCRYKFESTILALEMIKKKRLLETKAIKPEEVAGS